MLKVFGTVYSENENDFNAMKAALEKDGFQLAYRYPNNAEVIKEVANEQEDSAT